VQFALLGRLKEVTKNTNLISDIILGCTSLFESTTTFWSGMEKLRFVTAFYKAKETGPFVPSRKNSHGILNRSG
jgi:hypothetical protein